MDELEKIRGVLGHGADEELWPPGLTLSEAVARLVRGKETFTYRDALRWPPSHPVSEVEAEEVETLYSFAHRDGPWTGLVRWGGRLYYVEGFEPGPEERHYWMVYLSDEKAEELLRRAELWAERFGNTMTWNPDGTGLPFLPGNARQVWGDSGNFGSRWRDLYQQEVGDLIIEGEASVVGYFRGWCRK